MKNKIGRKSHTPKHSTAFRSITNKIVTISILILFIVILNTDNVSAQEKKYTVTFIELGSVRCVPCKQMQTVMKSIKEKYGSQVKVIFYDVWTSAGKQLAKQFTFQAIPTQIFLDKTGKEYFRHEGFFPEDELVKVLQQKGLFPSVK